MFVTPADFAVDGDKYLIPNITSEESEVDYETWIDETEEEILRQLLGDILYDQFIVGIGELVPEQKWLDLRDGNVYYLYQSKQYLWKGLKALLKPYIHSEWVLINHKQLNEAGVTAPTLENGETISASRIIVSSYNDYAKLRGSECEYKRTLFGFLKSNPTGYSTWEIDDEVWNDEMNIWNI